MKGSANQPRRRRLTPHELRDRESRKRNESDRAAWLIVGGEVAWQAELCRRRRERNARTRAHTQRVIAQRRAATVQPDLYGEIAA